MMYLIVTCIVLISLSVVWIAISIHRYVNPMCMSTVTPGKHHKTSIKTDNAYNPPEPDFAEINARLDKRKVNEREICNVEAHISGLGDEVEAEALDRVAVSNKLKGILK